MESLDRALQLMEESPAVWLTTIDGDGMPQTRAMLNLRRPGDYPSLVPVFGKHRQDLLVYCTTNTSSDKVSRIRANPRVAAYYCRSREWRGLCLSGVMEVVENPEVKRQLWQEGWNMYYPGGSADPDYAILRLVPQKVTGYHKLERYEFVPE